jgi:hypothetical protein
LFRELATVTGVAQRPLPAALSGSLNKAPGFAGGYLPADPSYLTASCLTPRSDIESAGESTGIR